MAQTIALKCPGCNAPLEAADDRPQFYCQFCGTRVVLADAVAKQNPPPHPNGPVRERGDVAIPEKLEVLEYGDELSISWKWFSWAVLFLIPFCIAWNAFLIGWYSMAVGFGDQMPGPMRLIFLVFPIAHVAVGLGLAYLILLML